MKRICSLEVAQMVGKLGYRERTEMFWDRHNPQSREGGKPTDPSIAWKLSPIRAEIDGDCCLSAPSDWQAVKFFVKIIVQILRGKL